MVRIERITEENKDTKTIIFPFDRESKPGQFFMILIPGVDEIPMSISYKSEEYHGITFKKVGEATSELFNKKANEIIGVRGPLGNGFSLKGKRILFVGGGTGISAIAPAVEEAEKEGKQVLTIIGAKTKGELFFVERLNGVERVKEVGRLMKDETKKTYISTDDGSAGYRGLASDLAREILDKNDFDLVITCGPEQMMKRIVEICNRKDIEVQASLERYMKCGMGICGHCVICKLRVCRDGPVFDGNILSKCKEFGLFKRGASGRRIYI
jgi:dihydroorotate dehydrogenase electron transfer subunit